MARSQTPLEQFVDALHHQNVDRVRELLATYPEVRAAINDPISYFQSRPVARATKNLPLLDVLLEHGADLNLKSAWWAGGFGLLEHDITPAEAAPLIARGAVVDVFAAAHLGMFDRLRELVAIRRSLARAAATAKPHCTVRPASRSRNTCSTRVRTSRRATSITNRRPHNISSATRPT